MAQEDRSQDRILVEVYCLSDQCGETQELVAAVANSVRWKDRIDLVVRHIGDRGVAATPYGLIDKDTIVVCGTHVVRNPDYAALTRALEDCEAYAS